MAKYDYDDPDFDDEDAQQTQHTTGSGWGRRLLVACLALVGIGLGFLIPYTLYLLSLIHI